MPANYTALLIFFVTGAVLPTVVDLVTKKWAEPRTKALVLLVLTLLTSLATDLFNLANLNGNIDGFDWESWLFGFCVTLVSSATTLFVVTKPLHINGADGVVARAIPGGVGRVVPDKAPEDKPNV